MTNITVNELKLFLLEKENFRLIDVREKWELDIAKIENSIELPLSNILNNYSKLNLDIEYAVICHSGVRSMQASGFLENKGYSVSNVIGGIDQWSLEIDPALDRY